VIGYELASCTGAELVRFVRTLGKHRYLAGRTHHVHAFAIEAAASDPGLAEAAEWADGVLDGGIELASKDPRLVRTVTDAELALVLAAFWEGDGTAAARLRTRLAEVGAEWDETEEPFDESREEDLFPVLVDAGWELLPLAHLDPERHKGAIQSFDDFEVAKFEEDCAIPPLVTLHELPLLGPVDLLAAIDPRTEQIRAPFVLWQEGHPTYLDYVLRGVLKVAKLPPPEDD